ncbi:MAG TPA: AI-2E family transporter [Candidatus Aenigmarchaeota archaeon]|nr:MAG: hypothetical protein DRN75_00095 [Nanoarchaeota archaeon]HDO79953.1 AI-2E family transporter [Candidatus Aenigmarchaeota archaeon]HEX33005.1 AI-2E family transporter [Candidatus Aenigmarchaeota archaeon]
MDVKKFISYLIVLVLVLLVVKPLFDVIVLAILTGFLLQPVKDRINKYTKRSDVSSAILVGLIGLFVFMLFLYGISILLSLAQKAAISGETISRALHAAGVQQTYIDIVNEQFGKIVSWFMSESQNFLRGLSVSLIKLAVWLFISFYTIKDWNYIVLVSRRLLGKVVNNKLVERDIETFLSILGGTYKQFFFQYLFVAVIVGFLAFFAYTVTGTPYAAFLSILSALAVIFPILTTYLVYLPATAWHLYVGHIWSALFLLVYGTVVLSVFPAFYLTPMLTSRKSNIHPVLVLVGLIGGPMFFGPIGFVYGPLIVGLGQSVYNYYLTKVLE